MLSLLYGPILTSIHDYWKNHSRDRQTFVCLARQTFVSKVMCLLFNMLSRFVIAFLPRSKRLLISWLQSPSAEILEPKKIESFRVSIEKEIANWHLFNKSYKDFWIQPLFIFPATFLETLMNTHTTFQPTNLHFPESITPSCVSWLFIPVPSASSAPLSPSLMRLTPTRLSPWLRQITYSWKYLLIALI